MQVCSIHCAYNGIFIFVSKAFGMSDRWSILFASCCLFYCIWSFTFFSYRNLGNILNICSVFWIEKKTKKKNKGIWQQIVCQRKAACFGDALVNPWAAKAGRGPNNSTAVDHLSTWPVNQGIWGRKLIWLTWFNHDIVSNVQAILMSW